MRAYILLLNWNGWKDTLSCLETLLRLDYADFRIVICDNASTDGSVGKIKEWFRGEMTVPGLTEKLNYLLEPNIVKDISWAEYDRAIAEMGGDTSIDPLITIINTGGNLGFAGGNNVGLRYISARSDFKYVWLLNNDTVVEKDSLSHLVARAELDESIGMVGSTLCYYANPDKLQAMGGATFDSWRMRSHPIGSDADYLSLNSISLSDVEQKLGYIIGASMLVSKNFLDKVGYMYEDYFLYYEELDWAERAKKIFSLAYAPKSRVYHKVGASAGTSARSFFSLKYLYVNQLVFTRRFYPRRIILARLSIFIEALRSIKKGFIREGLYMFRLAFHSVK